MVMHLNEKPRDPPPSHAWLILISALIQYETARMNGEIEGMKAENARAPSFGYEHFTATIAGAHNNINQLLSDHGLMK